jgi:hypothetical protein
MIVHDIQAFLRGTSSSQEEVYITAIPAKHTYVEFYI